MSKFQLLPAKCEVAMETIHHVYVACNIALAGEMSPGQMGVFPRQLL